MVLDNDFSDVLMVGLYYNVEEAESKYVDVSEHWHAHAHTQPFYGCLDFVRDYPTEPVPEGKSLDFTEARDNEWQ